MWTIDQKNVYITKKFVYITNKFSQKQNSSNINAKSCATRIHAIGKQVLNYAIRFLLSIFWMGFTLLMFVRRTVVLFSVLQSHVMSSIPRLRTVLTFTTEQKKISLHFISPFR
jgi:hypothetical protein